MLPFLYSVPDGCVNNQLLSIRKRNNPQVLCSVLPLGDQKLQVLQAKGCKTLFQFVLLCMHEGCLVLCGRISANTHFLSHNHFFFALEIKRPVIFL